MNDVKIKLKKITEIWNNLFFESKFLQSKIRFTTDIKTNYYGDILYYFNDTLDLVATNDDTENFQKNIFYVIGLLQIIYVHQDLIDELLYIFKLNDSRKEDKDPNRAIRNELVGHPISRDKNGVLKSSVIFDGDASGDEVSYLKYHYDKDFEVKSINHSINEIIDRHTNFLNMYLDKILSKIHKILPVYLSAIVDLENFPNNDENFEKYLSLLEYRLGIVLESNFVFEKEVILSCHEKINEHARYKFVIDLFHLKVVEALDDRRKYVESIIFGDEFKNNITYPIPSPFRRRMS